jgi:8-hydroxy-5-deazaflavin:NADPH oxidoreductase
MNIAVIGTGNVGGTLGKRLSRNGHQVMFAAREPQSEKVRSLVADAPNAKAASNAEAASVSDIVLLATPFPAAQQALREAGNLSGKIVIDATNPLLPTLEGLSVGCTDSAGEQVAKWAPGAKVVKAFNTVGANIMANPDFRERPVAMFYCGDDAAAKKTVAKLIAELGFEPLDAGPLKQARVLEPFAMLWISLALQYGYGPNFAFELLRRQPK